MYSNKPADDYVIKKHTLIKKIYGCLVSGLEE